MCASTLIIGAVCVRARVPEIPIMHATNIVAVQYVVCFFISDSGLFGAILLITKTV